MRKKFEQRILLFQNQQKIHSKETRREIKYFKFLKKRGISSSFIPSFISDFETKDEVIIEQELIARSS